MQLALAAESLNAMGHTKIKGKTNNQEDVGTGRSAELRGVIEASCSGGYQVLSC